MNRGFYVASIAALQEQNSKPNRGYATAIMLRMECPTVMSFKRPSQAR